MKLFTSLLFGLLMSAQFAYATPFEEGKHYQAVAKQGPSGKDGTVVVTEFFWFGCPHCNILEPAVNKWSSSLPAKVKFEQVPAPFNALWKLHAQLYFTLKALDQLDLKDAVFSEMHVKKNMLTSYEAIETFLNGQGVSSTDLENAWGSIGVRRELMNAAILVGRTYRLTGVPAFVVNGKWLVSVQTAGSEQALFEVIDYLVEQEAQTAVIDKKKKQVEELGP